MPARILAVMMSCSLPAAADELGKHPSADTVVFVCEHGSVKSLMAQEWFERLARERGLAFRAVSRGMTPDASVPQAIVEGLRRDGFDVGGFQPRALAAADLTRAVRVVAIGADTSSVTASAEAPIEKWEGIPPATQQYEAARDALRARIEGLLTALEGRERER